MNKKLVNLSQHMLSEIEASTLRKGLNFAIAPKNILTETIICDIEDIIQNLSKVDKETVRKDCAIILRTAKPPKSNLTKEEHLALKNLRNNEDIIIVKADKGGATVIMDKSEYNLKTVHHLTTSGSYRKLERNPISKVIREVKKAINSSNLDDKLKKRLTPSQEITPRIYGLPKIHKDGVPLRAIVNTIGSPTYELAKYVAKILGPLIGNSDSFIKDSSAFVKLI